MTGLAVVSWQLLAAGRRLLADCGQGFAIIFHTLLNDGGGYAAAGLSSELSARLSQGKAIDKKGRRGHTSDRNRFRYHRRILNRYIEFEIRA